MDLSLKYGALVEKPPEISKSNRLRHATYSRSSTQQINMRSNSTDMSSKRPSNGNEGRKGVKIENNGSTESGGASENSYSSLPLPPALINDGQKAAATEDFHQYKSLNTQWDDEGFLRVQVNFQNI